MQNRKLLLEIKNLKTQFFTKDGIVKAVDGISFDLHEGESLGIVGESGCGKSVTALSIMRLIPQPPGKIVSGRIGFEGQDLVKMKESDIRAIRGNKISMIFQDPMTSLNPVLTVGRQLSEGVELHLKLSKDEAQKKSLRLLEMVGIPAPALRINNYPHQFSGGMRQRVMIAMALSCNPKLLLADEPTTALDVTIQAQILRLVRQLCYELGTAVVLITHDLGVVAGMTDRILVMYAGRIIESASTSRLFANPKHPYTLGLLKSVPRLDEERKTRLESIEGMPPDLISIPSGCSFEPRCRFRNGDCKDEPPELVEIEEGHHIACWAA